MYDISIVSPRNFFLYTPLLPSACMGSVEDRSIVTPIRRVAQGKADYFEAKCLSVDTKRKVIHCGRIGDASKVMGGEDCFPDSDSQQEGQISFDLEYDILVYAVGGRTNDFGCPGVKEHAFFFKEIPDASKVRQRISDCFEIAALPTTTQEEKERLLSFVIVGGGPTGVEVAADLADFMKSDAADLYPKLIDLVKINLVNVGVNLLSTYSLDISKASLEVFQKKGVRVLSGYRVQEITKDAVSMKSSNSGEILNVPYGCVVWAAGVKDSPLTAQLKESLIERNTGKSERNVEILKRIRSRGVVVDETLHVRGSEGSIFALGDACTVRHDLVAPSARRLFDAGDVDRSGLLDMKELRDLLLAASDEFPQLDEYAQYLKDIVETGDDARLQILTDIFGQAADREKRAWRKAWKLTNERVGDRTALIGAEIIEKDLSEIDLNKDGKFDFKEFEALLLRVDQNLRSFPPTAQVAAQQGKYLSKLFAKGMIDGEMKALEDSRTKVGPFSYFHKGSLAYLGGGEAGFDLPVIGPITGPLAGVAWKAYETSAQLSWKNRALVGLDWLRESVFGRDTSRF
eukprot:TRINITY_DN6382_c0_g1_i1.p1 TRINITY_DN6382_c0_g1~~TRINITY_DN6382_c0_g1_i1.p1  ORF type:complete len:572 (+),score=116.42 TRINITY_DN6382_c0_g1_i1:488-2203(+)